MAANIRKAALSKRTLSPWAPRSSYTATIFDTARGMPAVDSAKSSEYSE